MTLQSLFHHASQSVFTVHLGYECMCVFQVTSAVSLCNPMDCSPPGSSVHGILQEEYRSGLSCPPLRDLPDPGIEPTSLCLLHWQAGSLPLVPTGKPRIERCSYFYYFSRTVSLFVKPVLSLIDIAQISKSLYSDLALN